MKSAKVGVPSFILNRGVKVGFIENIRFEMNIVCNEELANINVSKLIKE